MASKRSQSSSSVVTTPLYDSYTDLSPSRFLLAYASGTFSFSYSLMLTFVVTLRVRELGASLPQVGILIGAASLVAAFTSIPSGALTGRIGPKRVYVLGTALSSLGALIMAFSTSFWAILALQIALGSARTASWVASQTYITGVGHPSQRVAIAGRFSFATNLGTMVFPVIIGLVVQIWGLQIGLLFVGATAATYSLMGGVLPAVNVHRPGVEERASSLGFGSALAYLRLRAMQIAVLLSFVRVWYQSAWMTFYPVLLVEGGMQESVAGSVLAVASGVAMITSLFAGRMSKYAGVEVLTGITLALGALGVAISPHMTSLPWVYLPPLLYGVGVGVSLPTLLALFTAAAPASGRGVAMGIRTSSNQVAALTAPALSGYIIGVIGVSLGFLASSGIAWALVGFALVLHRVSKR